MKINNKEKGALGEKLAQDYLKKSGYKILDKNWHYSKFCELDIVAQKDNELVFVEVKYRTTSFCGSPVEAGNYYKLNNLKTAIMGYLQQTKVNFKSYRLDVIGIIGKDDFQIEHLKNIGL